MELYLNTVQDKQGNAFNGATVSVYVANTLTPATIYKWDASALSNPFYSGYSRSDGEIEFLAASGMYDIKIEAGGETEWHYDVSLIDAGLILNYAIGGQCNDKPDVSQVILRHVAPIAFTIPANCTGSICKAETATTAQADFNLLKNGVSFGTLRFAASGTTASFIGVSATAFVVGDILKIVAPASQDATLEDMAFTFLGEKN